QSQQQSGAPIQRKCACNDEELVQTKAMEGATARGDASHITSLQGGQPLPPATREFFESRLSYDFGNVRIHDDAQSAANARSINALAYTYGPNIVFGAGQYAPHTHAGQQLLAHELTHVVQQHQAPTQPVLQRKPDTPSQPKERAVQAPQKTCEEELDI